MLRKISTFIIVATTLFVSSCSSDNDRGTKVRYKITTDSGLDIGVVNYRNAAGQIVTVNATTLTEWQIEETVERPFLANVDAVLTNTGALPKDYDLIIYVDGNVAASDTGVVGDSEVITATASAQVD